ncbi:fer-1-like protein 6 [Macrosteles quadrilineatus]|uniref:fer-1-like protein 6 n=1 Tax=Macrosteles quadrilineatus TaxID=74068 RepID=UPI0023E2D7B4|nr:fer-1-like protein 6 [Macrosteles quadrilineatus]
MDWDAISRNDIIGETIIDIENRFYSKHRATCGLPECYETSGPNTWRDIETPRDILERLCNTHNLPLPQYHEKSVIIGSKEFSIHKTSLDRTENQQKLALSVLNHWEEMPIVGRHLVGEHVETRFLFREDRPGLVRGRLKMWVDMFDISIGNIPLPLDITPRQPQAYELRVNILNTAKIPLIDQYTFEDKKCTDILVTGWLGDPKTLQKTDVHYKSYTGEGNFNWRFVFPFMYYRKEQKMVFYSKNLFDIGKSEEKVSPTLHLQVYDSEGLMEDSLIGEMMFEICSMPRGAPSVRACKLERFLDTSNYVDLFKVYNLDGWWPFLVNSTVLKGRGFLEAEFFLITAEEARRCPVGLGRSPPDPLPPPARSSNRRNPLQVIEEMINRQNIQAYFGLTLNFFIVLTLIVLLGILVYTLPSMVEKLKPWLRETF